MGGLHRRVLSDRRNATNRGAQTPLLGPPVTRDQILRGMRHLATQPMSPGDTLLTWTSAPVRIHTAQWDSSIARAGLLRLDRSQGSALVRWNPILDSLRTNIGLDTLVDPGTADSRLDLLYRERAFWLLRTGHRLGDLRRLIRNYGRSAETVFPLCNREPGHMFATWRQSSSALFSSTSGVGMRLMTMRCPAECLVTLAEGWGSGALSLFRVRTL